MRHSRISLIAAALCLLCGTAHAVGASAPVAAPNMQPAIPPMQIVTSTTSPTANSGSRSEELAQLQAEIPVLKARAEIAKLKDEIAHPGGSKGGASTQTPGMGANMPGIGGMGGMTGLPAPTGTPAVSQKKVGEPKVLAITGYNDKLEAIVRVGNHQQTVNRGTEVDGWLVADVMPTAVLFSRAGKTLTVRP